MHFSNWSGKPVMYYHKGTNSHTEEYSIFANTEDGLKLRNHIKDMFKEHESVDIDVCGIAGDYCVLETLKGLRKFIGDDYITVLTDYTASIDGGEKLIKYLNENEISY